MKGALCKLSGRSCRIKPLFLSHKTETWTNLDKRN
jgi:hypothetical protein